MAKFYGRIGFAVDTEVRPSVWHPVIEERYYAGDMPKNYISTQSAEKPTDDFNINNDISIVADPFALNHFSSMKYVEVMGALWEVKSVTVKHPRLRISIGGIYRGPTPDP